MISSSSQSFEAELTESIAQFYADPLGYVMFNFPWDSEPSIQMVELDEPYRSRYGLKYGPDRWACEFLEDFGKEIRERKFDGKNAVPPIRFSTASGHGIGKSALTSWLILFILDTRPFSKGMVTATTSDQLRTKTWAELAKWHSLALSKNFWVYTSGRGSLSIYRKGDKEIQNNWRCDAQTCREENSEAFQGLHAASSTAFYIFDEASGIPDSIWEARQGGATDGEPMSFDFGNPTRKSGYFFENTVGEYKHRYNVRTIDSRDVKITNKQYLQDIVDDYGEDSDYVKVRVKGQFPRQGSVQFISDELVDIAMMREYEGNKHDPLIIGVDVARFGDDSTVIYPRIGMDAKSWGYKKYKGLDNTQVVEKVVEMLQEFHRLGRQCDGLFIDGGGLGAGPVDMLRRLGYNPIDVSFGSRSTSPRYRLRVDEIWGKMKDALSRLALPKDIELRKQLVQREYSVTEVGEKIQLESKKLMKERLGAGNSPDIADALALTFAGTPAMRFESDITKMGKRFAQSDYDPLEGGI